MAPRERAGPRGLRVEITFFGHFGTLNTGNDGTLLAVVSSLQALHPDWTFGCVCTAPEVVSERLGIEAVPISTRTARLWDRQVGFGRRLRSAIVGVGQEIMEWVSAYHALDGTTMFVIPGTGLLTDAFGLSAWGPYNLFKWSLVARMRGAKVRFLSVGAGPIYGWLGGRLLRHALSMADYRSYRDDASMQCVKSIGVDTTHDCVVPDLAFSLPRHVFPATERLPGRRRLVGLGLMMYPGRYSTSQPKVDTYPKYLESVVVFVRWLLAHNYDVRLLLGDGDESVIGELGDLLRTRLGSYDEARVSHAPIASVEDLLAQIETTDIVVATRFHNVLLALVLGKPVLAISFHDKCASLMRDVGLADYCQDVHELEVERLLEQFQALEEHAALVTANIEARVEKYRRALDAQYECLADGA